MENIQFSIKREYANINHRGTTHKIPTLINYECECVSNIKLAINATCVQWNATQTYDDDIAFTYKCYITPVYENNDVIIYKCGSKLILHNKTTTRPYLDINDLVSEGDIDLETTLQLLKLKHQLENQP